MTVLAVHDGHPPDTWYMAPGRTTGVRPQDHRQSHDHRTGPGWCGRSTYGRTDPSRPGRAGRRRRRLGLGGRADMRTEQVGKDRGGQLGSQSEQGRVARGASFDAVLEEPAAERPGSHVPARDLAPGNSHRRGGQLDERARTVSFVASRRRVSAPRPASFAALRSAPGLRQRGFRRVVPPRRHRPAGSSGPRLR